MKRIIVSSAIVIAGLFSAASYFLFQKEISRKELPVLGQVESFELVDMEGKPFSSDLLKGRVWISDFFFTTCSDICPVMSKNMASLGRSFEAVKGVYLVSITVNPEQDSPGALKKYAERFPQRPNNWFFLTGPRGDIRNIVVNSFKLGSVEEPIFHSNRFTLVDRNGLIRGYYDGTDQKEINRLFQDAAGLLKYR